MTNHDRVLDFVLRYPGRDDDEIAAALHISPRQTVNQICRRLANDGRIDRRPAPTGKIANYAGSNPSNAPISPVSVSFRQPQSHSGDATLEWFWEGNVVESLRVFFLGNGWEIVSCADTRTKQRGIDLHVKRSDCEIVIEVKGYPSVAYRDERRANEKKPTNPTLQAQHWYSHAFLKAARMLQGSREKLVAIGFPDFPQYRSLVAETSVSLERLGLLVLFVSESGEVSVGIGNLPHSKI